MQSKTILLAAISTVFLFYSCAPRLVGTWNVKKYETISPDNQGISLQNVGTITFEKNGTGQKDLNYSVLGIEKDDSTPFKWSASESYITIEGEDSDLAKTWIFVENKAKLQKWKATDGRNQVQSLELIKR
ncbi:MAG: hypothetical protein HKN31_14215 [Pricia sp.]|nr:hypothetical protein [Pricia sp.]